MPLSGVRVLLADSPRETTTDHDGQFVLEQLAPGDALVIFLRRSAC